jgi:hypothetical protein
VGVGGVGRVGVGGVGVGGVGVGSEIGLPLSSRRSRNASYSDSIRAI